MALTTTSQPFTWETAEFDWQSRYADNTWNTSAISEYALSLDESIPLRDTQRATTACLFITPLTATDHLTRTSTLCQEESLACTTATGNRARLYRTHTAPLTLTDHSAKSASLTTRDALSCQESTISHTTVCHAQPLTVCTQPTTLTDYRRTISETTTLTTTPARALTQQHTETLPLHGDRLTPYNGILSDITLTAQSMDDTLWQTCATSPSGYGAFHPFEVGEYTYRDALIRLILTIGAAGTHPLLYDVALHVDIDDIREHGLADCTADAKTRITLTHSYYHPPRIVLTTVCSTLIGTMPIPHLIEQGTQDGQHYFDCELRTPDGTRSAGTISYLAEGY